LNVYFVVLHNNNIIDLQINSDVKFDNKTQSKDMLSQCDDKNGKFLLIIQTFSLLFVFSKIKKYIYFRFVKRTIDNG